MLLQKMSGKNIATLTSCLVVSFFYTTQAMNELVVFETKDIVWKLFFTHNRDLLPYDDEHSFTQTSRNNCALAYSIQQQRKNCIYQYILKNNISFNDEAQFVYHRSWRMFGAVDIVKKKDFTSSQLRMFSCELNHNELPISKVAVWDNCAAKLSCHSSPFFNKNKQLCFYGIHKSIYSEPVPSNYFAMWQGVVEYTTSEHLPCELLAPSKNIMPLRIQLIEFLKFPVLLKNILDSDGSRVDFFENNDFSQTKTYYIDQVLLSPDYKKIEESSLPDDIIKSFVDLPQIVRNILAQRYKQQEKRLDFIVKV